MTWNANTKLNQRKITKWMFRLLERYHRRLGLKIAAWIGPAGIGTPRFTFFFDDARQGDSQTPLTKRTPNIDYLLMSPYQLHVGVQSGDQDYHGQHECELRTTEMIPWYEGQLRIEHHFSELSLRERQPGSRLWNLGDAYLRSWNVFGLWLKTRYAPPVYFTLGVTSCDYGPPAWLEPVLSTVGHVRDPWDILVLQDSKCAPGVYWGLDGLISRNNGQSIDLTVMAASGASPEAMVKAVSDLFAGLDLETHTLE